MLEIWDDLLEMLRDRLVCGVRDIRIQRWLLAAVKFTLKLVLDLALAIEAAYKNASQIHKADGQGGEPSVSKVDAKVNKGSEESLPSHSLAEKFRLFD